MARVKAENGPLNNLSSDKNQAYHYHSQCQNLLTLSV